MSPSSLAKLQLLLSDKVRLIRLEMSVCAPAFHFRGDGDEPSLRWEQCTGGLAWRAVSQFTTQHGALAWEGRSKAEDGNSGRQKKSPASLPAGPPLQPPVSPKVDQLSSSFLPILTQVTQVSLENLGHLGLYFQG